MDGRPPGASAHTPPGDKSSREKIKKLGWCPRGWYTEPELRVVKGVEGKTYINEKYEQCFRASLTLWSFF